MRTFTIFNGTRTVEIKDEIVEIFESVQGELDDDYVGLLALGYLLDMDTPQDVLNKTITEALIDEVQVVSQILDTFPAFLEEMGIE